MSPKEDPRMALIAAVRDKKRKKDWIGSAEVAKGDFRSLLRVALNDLVTAGTMALDRRLPDCLSLFAREIIQTENGVPYRPALRRLAREWIEDETTAMVWMDYLHRNQNEMDPDMYKLLYPLLKALIGEGKSKPEATELSKTM